jgi:hypothetical protein
MFILALYDSIKDGIVKGWEFLKRHYKWVYIGIILTLIIPPIIRLFI